ncbi:DUF6591 domain-containing protein [Bifidobacterium leontopitheci]|uniref:DUF6591 domain-containing protein n=1 Tax=Bifidobacterium leontopitheci TaxID=2650774 RepID=A0A6I1GFH3_9BIFI|nr:DUF6591 domain-containing protein [Bifidobacterium leontopitheci]KAB7790295.1 hypothetical protein F7D09_1191 [Bifidobacterium leontopitheci]
MKNGKLAGGVACMTLAAMILAGCGAGNGTTGNGGTGTNTGATASQPLDLSKVEYSVESTPVDSQRQDVMSFTNNTGVTLVSVELQYRQKDGVTDDQRKAAFADLRKAVTMIEDSDYEELKEEPLKCTSELIVKPGAKGENGQCVIGGWKAIGDFTSLMEPDQMTVAYLKDKDTIGMATYDFANKKTTLSKNEADANQWGDDKLTKTLPTPEPTIIRGSTSDTSVGYSVYGSTHDQFSSYVEECKKKGFTVDSSSDNSASMKGADGSSLSVLYFPDNETMTINLYAKGE